MTLAVQKIAVRKTQGTGWMTTFTNTCLLEIQAQNTNNIFPEDRQPKKNMSTG